MDYELNEGFHITNDKLADWALKKIKEEESERDRLTDLAKSQIEDLNNQMIELENQCNNKTSFLKSCLAEYFLKVPHKETKTQESYKLLSGSLVMKKPSQKIVHDDEALISYLKTNKSDEYIKVKESIDWANYKKNLGIEGDKVIDIDTGEVIEACSVEDVPASFDIKY